MPLAWMPRKRPGSSIAVSARRTAPTRAAGSAGPKTKPVPRSGSWSASMTVSARPPLARTTGGGLYALRDRLRELNWHKVGVARNGKDLHAALDEIEAIAAEARTVRLEGVRAYNMPWNNYIDFLNMIDVSRMVASAALRREETRGAHFRTDFPDQDDRSGLYNLFLQKGDDGLPVFERKPVVLKYMKPEDKG